MTELVVLTTAADRARAVKAELQSCIDDLAALHGVDLAGFALVLFDVKGRTHAAISAMQAEYDRMGGRGLLCRVFEAPAGREQSGV